MDWSINERMVASKCVALFDVPIFTGRFPSLGGMLGTPRLEKLDKRTVVGLFPDVMVADDDVVTKGPVPDEETTVFDVAIGGASCWS